jgi:hypothetical protein
MSISALSLFFQTLRTCSIVTGFSITGVPSIFAFFLIHLFRFNLCLCLWKVKGKILLKHIAKIYGRVELWFHAFLISALNEGEWSVSGPGCFKSSAATKQEARVGSKAVLGAQKKRKVSCTYQQHNHDSSEVQQTAHSSVSQTFLLADPFGFEK